MRIIFRTHLNEMVEVEEIGKGIVRVLYKNMDNGFEVANTTDIRESPNIVRWIQFGTEFVKGIREGITGAPGVASAPITTDTD